MTVSVRSFSDAGVKTLVVSNAETVAAFDIAARIMRDLRYTSRQLAGGSWVFTVLKEEGR